MNQSVGAMIAKIAFGLISIGAMFNGDQEKGTIIVGCVIGLALIAWGIVPIFTAKRDEKKAAELAAKRERAVRERIEAQKKAEAERPRYCSRCGAATKGSFCEYCGSALDE